MFISNGILNNIMKTTMAVLESTHFWITTTQAHMTSNGDRGREIEAA